jgi:hypothetical protein
MVKSRQSVCLMWVKADIRSASGNVRQVPISDIQVVGQECPLAKCHEQEFAYSWHALNKKAFSSLR